MALDDHPSLKRKEEKREREPGRRKKEGREKRGRRRRRRRSEGEREKGRERPCLACCVDVCMHVRVLRGIETEKESEREP